MSADQPPMFEGYPHQTFNAATGEWDTEPVVRTECGYVTQVKGERLVCVSPPNHAMEHRTADGTAFITGAVVTRPSP